MAAQLDWISSIPIDRGSEEPLASQLAGALEERIARGLLSDGTRLPPTRELAAVLRIHRGAVQEAYRRLQRAGLARGRVGSGTVVRRAESPERFDLDSLFSPRLSRLTQDGAPAALSPAVADFSRLTPDERFFPVEEFTETLASAWSRRADLWQYAPPLGLEELRREISRRLAEHGIDRGPAEILVTSGAQQGLDLLFRTFTDPGDAVAMESPTYPGALALARFAGVEIVSLPVGPDGPDTGPLAGRRVKFVYVMPERQNPTGVTTGEWARAALLQAAAASGALVVEDGYEEPESGLAPLAVRDPERTVWLGTLSKDLVPGFRIGWIAGPAAVIERLALVKKTADFQTPLPLQAAVAAFLAASGDRRARRERTADVEAKRVAAAAALAAYLPEVRWWGGEAGNPLFWLHLAQGLSGRRVAEAAAARGIGVAAGCDFDPQGEDLPNVRLSVSRVDRKDVEPGIRGLAQAVAAVAAVSGARGMPVV